ncbi:MAG: hypothetical protein QM767_04705 [Anaeromyxobacter sp.]
MDLIGNVYKAGPMTRSGHVVQAYPAEANRTVPSGLLSLHLDGNVAPGHADPAADGWGALTAAVPDENADEGGPLDTALRRATPLPAPGRALTVDKAGPALEAAVLATVGASRRLGCDGRWVDARDALDRRLVQDYRDGTGPRHAQGSCTGGGCLPQSELDTPEAGFPDQPTAEACPDGDHDGLPDAWEAAHGLDPADPADARAALPDGTTQLETYLAGEESPASRRAGR